VSALPAEVAEDLYRPVTSRAEPVREGNVTSRRVRAGSRHGRPSVGTASVTVDVAIRSTQPRIPRNSNRSGHHGDSGQGVGDAVGRPRSTDGIDAKALSRPRAETGTGFTIE